MLHLQNSASAARAALPGAAMTCPPRRVPGKANDFDKRAAPARAARHRQRPLWAGATSPRSARGVALAAWARHVRARYGTRQACAAAHPVTLQTACNWFDGRVGPQFVHVLTEWQRDPAALARALNGAA